LKELSQNINVKKSRLLDHMLAFWASFLMTLGGTAIIANTWKEFFSNPSSLIPSLCIAIGTGLLAVQSLRKELTPFPHKESSPEPKIDETQE
jgi:hypothetical protein